MIEVYEFPACAVRAPHCAGDMDLLLLSALDVFRNDADTLVLAQPRGIERQIVITHIQPFGPGIVLVIKRLCLRLSFRGAASPSFLLMP